MIIRVGCWCSATDTYLLSTMLMQIRFLQMGSLETKKCHFETVIHISALAQVR